MDTPNPCNVAIVRGTVLEPARGAGAAVRAAAGAAAGDDHGSTAAAMSVPVSVLDPPAWVEELDAGDEVVVLGRVRRRFFRAGGATASRVEIEAEVVCRGPRPPPARRRRCGGAIEALDAAAESTPEPRRRPESARPTPVGAYRDGTVTAARPMNTTLGVTPMAWMTPESRTGTEKAGGQR